MELYDINSAIQGYGQNFNAMGELGRFMLQRKAQDAQQAQQAYQNRLTDADRSRMDAERKLKQEQQDQIRQILLGSQTTTVETPYTEEVAEPVQYPDISAFMQGMGGTNLSSRDLNAPAPNPDKPWESSFVRSLVRTQELPATPSLAETMTGQKPVEPVKWQLPLAPAEMMKRTVTKTRTEQVPNENWMGDAAGKVAAIDPELGMDMAMAAASTKDGGIDDDDRTAVEVRNLRNLVASNNFANLDEATQEKYLGRLAVLESGQAGTKYAPNADTQQAGAVAAPDFAAAKGEASTLIGSVRDANNDGNIDDYARNKARLEDIIRNAGLGKGDADALRSMFDDKATEVQATYRAGLDKQERKKAEARAKRAEARSDESAGQSGGAIDKRAASQKIEDIQANPNDNTTIADAVLWYMRKQSGAMIGPTEILQYMQGKLPQDKYSQLVNELSPTGLKAIAGYVAGSAFSDPMITQITAKYTPYIKKDRLIRDLNVYAQKSDKSIAHAATPAGGAGGGKPLRYEWNE